MNSRLRGKDAAEWLTPQAPGKNRKARYSGTCFKADVGSTAVSRLIMRASHFSGRTPAPANRQP